MEGRKTWKEDPGTPIQPKFNITTAGSATVFDTVNGVQGTITQGLSFFNEATNPFAFYYLVPVPPAFSILQDNNLLVSCAVAYNSGIYKTIGALFEFSAMAGLPPESQNDLMLKYLDFFDIYANPTGVEEKPGVKEGWQVYPNPASSQLTVVSHQSLVDVLISDLFGREVMKIEKVSSFPYQLDISGLPDGMYVLRLMSETGESSSLKFLKISE
jgi:hypothetical protein